MLEQMALGVKGSIVPSKFPWARKPDEQDAALAAIFRLQDNGALTAKDVHQTLNPRPKPCACEQNMRQHTHTQNTHRHTHTHTHYTHTHIQLADKIMAAYAGAIEGKIQRTDAARDASYTQVTRFSFSLVQLS
jgi:ABC-type Zn2+ transport system substrate-binding protein/surface adhesin